MAWVEERSQPQVLLQEAHAESHTPQGLVFQLNPTCNETDFLFIILGTVTIQLVSKILNLRSTLMTHRPTFFFFFFFTSVADAG
jgi:hypothetical protein